MKNFQIIAKRRSGVAIMMALCLAAAGNTAAAGEKNKPFDHTHQQWQGLLKTYVKSGTVDYAAWHRGGQDRLDQYLATLAAVCKKDYKKWNKRNKIAYWINLYNAHTIKLVLDNFPVKSLQNVGAKPGSAWEEKRIPLAKLEGKTLSLGDVENEILRKRFTEPRIHFALVCAAKSCPILISEAYQGQKLNTQLKRQTRQFLNDSSKNRYDAANKTLYLSKIFEWYGKDFVDNVPSVAAYVAPHMSHQAVEDVAAGQVNVEFLHYDWALNGR
ncbi:MAG: DUF547 domain-containing protein [Myxococcota bacterium]|nr:DUF547 domain-containing protein [Myxococcota bacterium]